MTVLRHAYRFLGDIWYGIRAAVEQPPVAWVLFYGSGFWIGYLAAH